VRLAGDGELPEPAEPPPETASAAR
jgi:hypothetical protein